MVIHGMLTSISMCPDLLECLNGEHKDQVSPLGALKFTLEKLV